MLAGSEPHEFYNKNGYKYAKYRQAVEYIKNNGYDAFFKIADHWKNAYGKYPGVSTTPSP